MKKNLVLTLVTLLCLGAIVIAKPKKAKVTGFLIDKACSGNVAKKENPMEAAGNHTKKCALMEKCVASGLGVFADGKFYELDDNGKAMAKAFLEKSTLDKGVKVTVEGTADEAMPTMLTVKKLVAAKEGK
ncbi:MAG: hypothetical protein JST84_20420 [Acidobacteria bacterium]|nr:hypothetical protein [Acidobacteriota bacterium]